MKRLIIFFTVLLVCIFSVYPPFDSKANKLEQLQTIQATETTIQGVEKVNDDNVQRLKKNLYTIDSLNAY